MNTSNMKNMVVLKNLPSNLVEEAIVVLKENARIKNFEKAENCREVGFADKKEDEKEYVLKEAEMLVSDYISRIEENKNPVLNNKTKRFKRWAYISTIVAIVECLIILEQ